jgi:hypothetical protein
MHITILTTTLKSTPMKIILQKPLIAISLCLLLACNNGNDKSKNYAYEKIRADSVSTLSPASDEKQDAQGNADFKSDTQKPGLYKRDVVSSMAAKEDNKHPERKFIRTADLKFKVKNVIKASYAIEDVIGRNDGYITSTNLTSTAENQATVPISEDSSLESIYFNVSNTIIARVPNTKLDSTLKSMAGLVDFLDYRIIKANDVALQLRGNQLLQNRNNLLHQRITHNIDSKGHKLPETTDAEENAASHQEASDNALLTNINLTDQVKYSTINLSLYQRQEVKKLMVANDKNIKPYEPSLGRRMAAALTNGWSVLQAILVFFAQIWWLIIIVAMAMIGIIRYNRKNKALA